MTIAEQLASAEGNSPGSENIPKIPRTGAAFRRTESGEAAGAIEQVNVSNDAKLSKPRPAR